MSFEITSARELNPVEAASLDSIDDFIAKMEQHGDIPHVTKDTAEAMKKSLAKYFQQISADKIEQFADKAKEVVEQTLKTMQEARPGQSLTTTVGTGTAPARVELTEFLADATGENVAEKMDMDFFIKVAREVAQGAGHFVAMNENKIRVDEFPAVELVRVYSRRVPRGSTGREGDDDWPIRFEAAGGELINGRMIALKNDDVWQKLGDGEGGYNDTLGNPFPPFAFSSGMDWDEIDRDEAENLGLLEDGEEAKPAEIDFEELFSISK